MVYALIIAAGAALLLLAIPALLYAATRRAKDGRLSISGWSFRPNALALSIIAIVAGIALSRVFPAFLFLPLIIPLFWRFRWGGGGGGGGGGRGPGGGPGPFVWQWRVRREPPRSTNGHSNGHEKEGERPIEGKFRNLDEE